MAPKKSKRRWVAPALNMHTVITARGIYNVTACNGAEAIDKVRKLEHVGKAFEHNKKLHSSRAKEKKS